MNKAQAIHNFWSRFTWPAYDANTVPDDAALPRITYELALGSFGDYQHTGSASLWVRSTGWAEIEQKAYEIGAVIGRGGIILPFDNGTVWVKRGEPWSTRMSDPEDTMIRRIILQPLYEFESED